MDRHTRWAFRYTQRKEEYLPLQVPVEAAVNLEQVEEYKAKKAELEAKGERMPGDEIVRAKIPIEAVLSQFLQEELVDDFYSSAIKGKTTAKKTVRISTFPDYLLIQLLKFRVDESRQPVKLDVEVDMPDAGVKRPRRWGHAAPEAVGDAWAPRGDEGLRANG